MIFFIPEEKIFEIKNTADIVDVVSESVLLKKSGRNHLGLCPFHSEKTPSFTVSYEKQIFYCFGCGAGGNVFAYLMKKEGFTFPEAVKYVAEKYGIDIPEKLSPEQNRKISEKDSIFSINKQAMEFFKSCLLSSGTSKKAFEYLNKREISENVIRDYHLGYAPDGWNVLLNYFNKINISTALLEKAGLIVRKNKSEGFYDRFRNRIIFPIFDINSQVIGFGGRVMDDSLPKYLNSPETMVFNKSQSLYGLDIARSECRITETVYIVEGYFDLLSLHKNGIKNSVATLGTSISHEHVKILRGIVGKDGKFILVYDSDDAGIKAAQRSIEIFDKGFADAKVLVLPSGYDPDSYLVKFGIEAFKNAVSNAQGAVSFLINSAIKKYGLSVEGKIRIVSELKNTLSSIDDHVARALYIRELSEKIDIDEAAIHERIRETLSDIRSGKYINKSDAGPVPNNQDVAGSEPGNMLIEDMQRGTRFERQIIAMMLQFPEMIPEIIKCDLLSGFTDDVLKAIGNAIIEQKSLPELNSRNAMPIFDDDEKNSIAAFLSIRICLSIRDEVWGREDCLKLIKHFEYTYKRNEDTSTKKIKEAEETKDGKLLSELLREKQIQAKDKRSNRMKALGGETIW
ncbi:MAG: DNA primase [Proteobacteria bacterium]|nr:DNA primase [Pseudomonadota bacterium]MBU4037341.1 DNA primase [Pseudomonadota bacterium]